MFRTTLPFIILGFVSLVFIQPSFSQEEKIDGEILTKADSSPLWNGCLENDSPISCTEEELSKYLKEHLLYPKAALNQHLEGKVIVGCIISRKGKVVRSNLIHDIGGGCGDEAIRIIKNMPLWIPAKNKGEPVNIIYNIEVPFTLEEEEIVFMEEPMKPIVPEKNKSLPKGKSIVEQINEMDVTVDNFFSKEKEMPYFPGCDEYDHPDKKRECSNQKLLAYMAEHLKYPEEAKESGVEGIVYVEFNVGSTGELTQLKIKRDIGGGCGNEAMRVVKEMPIWEPGKIMEKPVPTTMSLPVRFSLSKGANSKYQIHWGNLKKNEITPEQIEKVITEDILVRNRMGDHLTISTLNITYEKKSKTKEENSIGDVTIPMMRLLRKAKPGGRIIITATIQEKTELFDIQRIFEVVSK